MMFRLLILVAALTGLGCGGPPRPYVGLPNFLVVDSESKIYRGGQPCNSAAWAQLKALGIERVIKLNQDSEGSDAAATALGLEIVYLPISVSEQLFGSPAKANLDHATAVMLQGKCYIHCGSDGRSKPDSLAARTGTQGGQDRTGLAVACFRVWKQHWTKNDAQKEMIECGFHPSLPGLARFWRDQVK